MKTRNDSQLYVTGDFTQVITMKSLTITTGL